MKKCSSQQRGGGGIFFKKCRKNSKRFVKKKIPEKFLQLKNNFKKLHKNIRGDRNIFNHEKVRVKHSTFPIPPWSATAFPKTNNDNARGENNNFYNLVNN